MKKLLVCMGICLSVHLGAQEATEMFAITQVHNYSDTKARIFRYIIQAMSSKKLSQPIMVPFISHVQDRSSFLEERPYLPEQALMVVTHDGRWGIWQDETGVMCAPDARSGTHSYDECVPRRLLRHLLTRRDEGVVYPIQLTIDAAGCLKIENH